MYHIKTNARTRKSAQRIYDALEKCMEYKPFDKITINDIQHESGVGRSTFYRLFDNLSDVLEYRCDITLDHITSKVFDKPHPGGEKLKTILRFATENASLLQMLKKSDNMQLLQNSYTRHAMAIMPLIPQSSALNGVDLEYLFTIFSYALVGALDAWTHRDQVESGDDIYNISLRCVDALYASYHSSDAQGKASD